MVTDRPVQIFPPLVPTRTRVEHIWIMGKTRAPLTLSVLPSAREVYCTVRYTLTVHAVPARAQVCSGKVAERTGGPI